MTRQLLEIVSKGGNLLLNNGPSPEGEIRRPAEERLKEMGLWMKKNSEGIYGSSPWRRSCEVLAQKPIENDVDKPSKENTMKDAVNDATSKVIFPEVRFTTKDNYLYAYVCSVKENNITIKSLSTKEMKIEEISMLGSGKKVKWKQSENGLEIEMPKFSKNQIPIVGYKIINTK
jgi:alpha-L-fucosidase